MVLFKREGLLPGPGLVWSLMPVFLAALVAVFLGVLVLFSGTILVAVLCLDKGWILVWSFGFLFLLLFSLALSLLSWLLFWSLLLCSWGLGPGLVLAWSFQFVLVTILVVIFCM